MKIDRKNISFQRGGDPYRKLGVGKAALIEKWFNDLGISSDEYTIDKDFNINVEGSLDLEGTDITSLPNDLSVGGSLYLSEIDIISLPNDLSVGGSLDLWKTKITSLPNNLSIGGSLNLSRTKITSLPDNLSVGRNIWLNKDKKDKIYVPEYLKEKIQYI